MYARDPDNTAIQYLCQVVNQGNPGVTDPIVAVYPDADVEPDINSLPADCMVQLPESALQSVPFVGAIITGYAATIAAAGGVPLVWSPAKSPRHAAAPPAPPAPPARPLVDVNAKPPTPGEIETTAKAPSRPERDGKFGGLFPQTQPAGVAQGVLQPGVGAALAQQVTRVQADLAATAPPAATTAYVPQVGDVVVVKPTEAPYWKAHVGKQVTITEVSEGLNGPDISFMLDGFEQPPVAASRFELVQRIVPVAPFVSGLSVAPEAPVTFEGVSKLKGQLVSVRLRNSEIPQNGSLGDVYQTDEGPALSMHDGKLRVFLKDVASCKLLDIGDVPGAIKPKARLSPEEKAAAKAEKAAAKAAAKAEAKAPSIPGQQDLQSIVGAPPSSAIVAQAGALQQPPAPTQSAPPPLFTPAEQAAIAGMQPLTPNEMKTIEWGKRLNEVMREIASTQAAFAAATGKLINEASALLIEAYKS